MPLTFTHLQNNTAQKYCCNVVELNLHSHNTHYTIISKTGSIEFTY